jgi:hypothetical protein
MVQACLQTPAKIKMVTGSCHNKHTTWNAKIPGGICQVILNTILSLHKASSSHDIGHWVWQELQIDGSRSLYIITAYRVCL